MAKCRICKKSIYNRDINSGNGIVINYHEINHYFCSEEHCKVFFLKEKEKEKEKEGLDKIHVYVRNEIFKYDETQKLPDSFYSRIKDLRNGSSRGHIRNIKNNSKKGYPYEVILDCFKEQTNTILFWLEGKLSGSKESDRINYMMAIIEANLNDVYERYLNRTKVISKEMNIEYLDIDITPPTTPDTSKVNKNDLSAFFDND